MKLSLIAILFLDCVVLTMFGSVLMTRGLDALGEVLGIPAGLFGLITALGANAPEISSAVTALVSGVHDVGLGVVVGSNVFNLAALLGLSAVVAGKVRVRRRGLALHGGVNLWVTLAGGALVLGWLSPVLGLVLMGLAVLPYAVVLALPPRRLRALPLPAGLTGWLARSVSETRPGVGSADDKKKSGARKTPGDEHACEEQECAAQESGRAKGAEGGAANVSAWRAALTAAVALAVIVGGSIGMVKTALRLADAWGVPHRVTGTLILAALTGLPNAYAAARLARAGRGTEVVSESFNSNTLNLLIGVALPALVFGAGGAGSGVVLEVAWLLGMTVAVIGLAAPARTLSRAGGAGVIALYVAFVGVWIARGG